MPPRLRPRLSAVHQHTNNIGRKLDGSPPGSHASFLRAIIKDESGPGGANARDIRRARITAAPRGYETLLLTPGCARDTLIFLI